jgi:hypothetical protein
LATRLSLIKIKTGKKKTNEKNMEVDFEFYCFNVG